VVFILAKGKKTEIACGRGGGVSPLVVAAALVVFANSVSCESWPHFILRLRSNGVGRNYFPIP